MTTTGVSSSYQSNRQKGSPFVSYYHQNLYSTQPILTPAIPYSSEWRSPTNTPNKDMATQATTVAVEESGGAALSPHTPSKLYVTPVRDKVVESEAGQEQTRAEGSRAGRGSVPATGGETTGVIGGVTSPTKAVHSMDVLWGMLNTVVGKDKMAKIGQYTLRLLLYHASKTQEFLSDEHINIALINDRYYDRTAKLSLLQNFVKHPANFSKIVMILACAVFSSRLTPMVGGLAMYRQFLRFGKTPFRLRNFMHLLSGLITKDNTIDLKKARQLLTTKTCSDVFGLYYGIHDEILLLFKLKFFTNKSLQKYASRHEARAWYYETLLALYTSYQRLQLLSQQEMDMRIQIQVKQRAKLLSKQLLGGSQITSSHHEDSTDIHQLRDIQFKKVNSYIDIYKWLADFAFNTYTVFSLPLPFDTFQIWMGIAASLLSCTKLYRETHKKLAEKAH